MPSSVACSHVYQESRSGFHPRYAGRRGVLPEVFGRMRTLIVPW